MQKCFTVVKWFLWHLNKQYSKKYTRSYDYDIRTFDGAYNQIYKWIEEASLKRVMDGKSAIKVVSVGLFYSERTQHYINIVNRNVTKNKYGYTLLDYQKEIYKYSH